ncbi:hypothetical protein U4E84_02750 [Halorubrum sp. AD140]|uniref:DUF7285 family protein n=1 Tax=Halorubrum sp. AD140 TaxID=3050073 RepID=UPI002ACCE36A|nr:hypothetical protein [Halorubrum sp. AD140]MDZ5810274.1 hypothetical protein [Halorubrum sp. AD140]
MSRSSAESSEGGTPSRDRAAVEPLAALVAVLAVGAALSLYAAALDDATVDRERPTAELTLDRVEATATSGGVVDPDRLRDIEEFRYPTAVVLEADGGTWRVESGRDAPHATVDRRGDATAVAERAVTVRVDPGRNVRGTLRAVVRR